MTTDTDVSRYQRFREALAKRVDLGSSWCWPWRHAWEPWTPYAMQTFMNIHARLQHVVVQQRSCQRCGCVRLRVERVTL